MPLCFAYGSNMDRAAMAARCPASRALGPARLPRHRLAIMREGYLTVVRDPRREVRGLLWDVAFADMPALDRYEDVGSGLYAKTLMPVIAPQGPRKALVYLGSNAGPGEPLPGYLEGVVAAADALGWPPAHLRDLLALLPGAGRAAAVAAGRPAVTPRRRSPLDPEPADRMAKWRWTP